MDPIGTQPISPTSHPPKMPPTSPTARLTMRPDPLPLTILLAIQPASRPMIKYPINIALLHLKLRWDIQCVYPFHPLSAQSVRYVFTEKILSKAILDFFLHIQLCSVMSGRMDYAPKTDICDKTQEI